MSNYGAIIAGTGSYLPEKRLTNADLSVMVDTSDDWIVQRTGIHERRVAGADETATTLATAAARKALEAAGLAASDLDLIVCATCTGDMLFPSTACLTAAALGLTLTPAFDITAACCGFLYALQTATAFVRSGIYKNVLVIGAEVLSRIVDYGDRGSCILFGDGAGAAIVQRTADPARGVIYSSLYGDGSGADMIYCKPGNRRPVKESPVAAESHFMQLRGREVYKFAVQRFEELIVDAMRKCELTANDIKLIVPHQVNQRIIDSAMHKLGFPMEKAYINIDRYGNTSAASIPIALDEAVRAGKIVKGDVILMVAFGAGLTWANAVVRM